MSMNEIKLTTADKIIKSVCFILTLFWILCLVFPIYWMIVSSMKDSTAQYAKTPQLGITIPFKYTAVIDYDSNPSDDVAFADANVVLWQMFSKVKGNIGCSEVIATVKGKPVKAFELTKAKNAINKRLVWNKSILNSKDILSSIGKIRELDCVTVTKNNIKLPAESVNKYSKEMFKEYSSEESISGKLTKCTYCKSPKNLFDNYKIAWDYPNRLGIKNGLLQPITNTLFIALMTYLIGTFLASISAYAISKLLTRGIKTKVMTIVMMSGMVSPILLLIPKYQVLNNIGLTNSLWGVILPAGAGFGAMLLYKVQFDAYPNGIIEAARIDGASEFTIYLRFVLPSAKALMVYNGLLTFATVWGDFFWPMMVLRDPEKYNLGIVLNILLNGSGTTPDYAVSLALGFLISVPTLIIYAVFQKQLGYSVDSGAIKG